MKYKLKMKRVLVTLVISLLLIHVSISLNNVKAESNQCVMLYGGGTLFCHVNTTYSSNALTLNLTFGVGLGVQCSLNYDIDGIYRGPIPLIATNPEELHVVNPTAGIVALPRLSEGPHYLKITVNAGITCGSPGKDGGTNFPSAPFKSSGIPGNYEANWINIVYFTIDTSGKTKEPPAPPSIISLSLQNNTTYNATDIPLSFMVNENISQSTYSLDGERKVPFEGNASLENLSYGAHNLTLYLVDYSENNVSQTINFIVASPAPMDTQPPKSFPTILVITASAVFALAASMAVVYIKKHKTPKTNIS